MSSDYDSDDSDSDFSLEAPDFNLDDINFGGLTNNEINNSGQSRKTDMRSNVSRFGSSATNSNSGYTQVISENIDDPLPKFTDRRAPTKWVSSMEDIDLEEEEWQMRLEMGLQKDLGKSSLDPLGLISDSDSIFVDMDKQLRSKMDVHLPSFDPVVFMLHAHKNTSYERLLTGLKRLDKTHTSRASKMKDLVQQHFGQFVHCKDTIDLLHALLQSEIDYSKQTTTKTQSKTIAKSTICHSAKVSDLLSTVSDKSAVLYQPMLSLRHEMQRVKNTLHVTRKLKVLFELPGRLRTHVINRQHTQVVLIYRRVLALKMPPSLHNTIPYQVLEYVRSVCHAYAHELAETLSDPRVSLEQQQRVMGYLLDLDYSAQPGWYYLARQCVFIINSLDRVWEERVVQLNTCQYQYLHSTGRHKSTDYFSNPSVNSNVGLKSDSDGNDDPTVASYSFDVSDAGWLHRVDRIDDTCLAAIADILHVRLPTFLRLAQGVVSGDIGPMSSTGVLRSSDVDYTNIGRVVTMSHKILHRANTYIRAIIFPAGTEIGLEGQVKNIQGREQGSVRGCTRLDDGENMVYRQLDEQDTRHERADERVDERTEQEIRFTNAAHSDFAENDLDGNMSVSSTSSSPSHTRGPNTMFLLNRSLDLRLVSQLKDRVIDSLDLAGFGFAHHAVYGGNKDDESREMQGMDSTYTRAEYCSNSGGDGTRGGVRTRIVWRSNMPSGVLVDSYGGINKRLTVSGGGMNAILMAGDNHRVTSVLPDQVYVQPAIDTSMGVNPLNTRVLVEHEDTDDDLDSDELCASRTDVDHPSPSNSPLVSDTSRRVPSQDLPIALNSFQTPLGSAIGTNSNSGHPNLCNACRLFIPTITTTTTHHNPVSNVTSITSSTTTETTIDSCVCGVGCIRLCPSLTWLLSSLTTLLSSISHLVICQAKPSIIIPLADLIIDTYLYTSTQPVRNAIVQVHAIPELWLRPQSPLPHSPATLLPVFFQHISSSVLEWYRCLPPADIVTAVYRVARKIQPPSYLIAQYSELVLCFADKLHDVVFSKGIRTDYTTAMVLHARMNTPTHYLVMHPLFLKEIFDRPFSGECDSHNILTPLQLGNSLVIEDTILTLANTITNTNLNTQTSTDSTVFDDFFETSDPLLNNSLCNLDVFRGNSLYPRSLPLHLSDAQPHSPYRDVLATLCNTNYSLDTLLPHLWASLAEVIAAKIPLPIDYQCESCGGAYDECVCGGTCVDTALDNGYHHIINTFGSLQVILSQRLIQTFEVKTNFLLRSLFVTDLLIDSLMVDVRPQVIETLQELVRAHSDLLVLQNKHTDIYINSMAISFFTAWAGHVYRLTHVSVNAGLMLRLETLFICQVMQRLMNDSLALQQQQLLVFIDCLVEDARETAVVKRRAGIDVSVSPNEQHMAKLLQHSLSLTHTTFSGLRNNSSQFGNLSNGGIASEAEVLSLMHHYTNQGDTGYTGGYNNHTSSHNNKSGVRVVLSSSSLKNGGLYDHSQSKTTTGSAEGYSTTKTSLFTSKTNKDTEWSDDSDDTLDTGFGYNKKPSTKTPSQIKDSRRTKISYSSESDDDLSQLEKPDSVAKQAKITKLSKTSKTKVSNKSVFDDIEELGDVSDLSDSTDDDYGFGKTKSSTRTVEKEPRSRRITSTESEGDSDDSHTHTHTHTHTSTTLHQKLAEKDEAEPDTQRKYVSLPSPRRKTKSKTRKSRKSVDQDVESNSGSSTDVVEPSFSRRTLEAQSGGQRNQEASETVGENKIGSLQKGKRIRNSQTTTSTDVDSQNTQSTSSTQMDTPVVASHSSDSLSTTSGNTQTTVTMHVVVEEESEEEEERTQFQYKHTDDSKVQKKQKTPLTSPSSRLSRLNVGETHSSEDLVRADSFSLPTPKNYQRQTVKPVAFDDSTKSPKQKPDLNDDSYLYGSKKSRGKSRDRDRERERMERRDRLDTEREDREREDRLRREREEKEREEARLIERRERKKLEKQETQEMKERQMRERERMEAMEARERERMERRQMKRERENNVGSSKSSSTTTVDKGDEVNMKQSSRTKTHSSSSSSSHTTITQVQEAQEEDDNIKGTKKMRLKRTKDGQFIDMRTGKIVDIQKKKLLGFEKLK